LKVTLLLEVNKMRADYGLFVLALICFIIAGLVLLEAIAIPSPAPTPPMPPQDETAKPERKKPKTRRKRTRRGRKKT
jgi:hypothetical protein